ncbi:hypothetical protein FACS1894189_9230 [Planctomycetales bacterium]|nr:hypothetical protein FACS1894189_9230 [Planctomycetales bacterium]
MIHIRLRDTTEKQFQVRIGQGIIEFSRLVIQLNKVDYRRALCVDLAHLPDVDPLAELHGYKITKRKIINY